MTQIRKEARAAGLSPLATRLAVVLADIDGKGRAREYITEIKRERERMDAHARWRRRAVAHT